MQFMKPLLVIGLAFGLNLLSFAQNAKNITITPEHPVQGENIQINYRPANGIGPDEQVKAVIYQFCSYQWTADDLQLKQENGNWTSTYKLPEDCGLFALKFIGDSISDTDKSGYGYVWFVLDANGQNAKGAYAGWGLMRTPNSGCIIPDYFDLSKSAISDTATYYWINQEITFHNKEAATAFAYEYCRSLKKSGMLDAGTKITRCLNYLQTNPTEKNLLSAEAIYRSLLENNEKADSIRQINMAKNPSGSLNRLTAYRKAILERDMDIRNNLLKKFLSDFPEKPEDNAFNSENVISYDNIYLSLLIPEIFKKNYNALYEYLPKFSLGGLINVYYKIIDIPHSRKDLSDDFLYPYAKSLVDQILKEKNDKPDQYQFLSPNEWDLEFDRMVSRNVLISYVSLLRNSGHPDEALQFAMHTEKILNYTVADLNDDVCHLLLEAGKQEELHEVLLKSMYNNQVSPSMIELLKQAYIGKNGSETGFTAYMESLKKPELQNKASERILKDKREGKMPEWEMTDATGKKISSKDLLGKNYVLDFWASWCVPCKASFPGMKLAVERYQNDPDVAFFFVDTEEQSDKYKEMAIQYIAGNNFPFHILFDNKAEGGKVNDEVFSRICKAFTISGIPQKIFVDKNGNVRFISVGYKGSPSELSDDISIMVEETKKAGK